MATEILIVLDTSPERMMELPAVKTLMSSSGRISLSFFFSSLQGSMSSHTFNEKATVQSPSPLHTTILVAPARLAVIRTYLRWPTFFSSTSAIAGLPIETSQVSLPQPLTVDSSTARFIIPLPLEKASPPKTKRTNTTTRHKIWYLDIIAPPV